MWWYDNGKLSEQDKAVAGLATVALEERSSTNGVVDLNQTGFSHSVGSVRRPGDESCRRGVPIVARFLIEGEPRHEFVGGYK